MGAIIAAGASAGISLSWNPVGWIILAIVALVAIYYYRKEIANFFSFIGSAIIDTAKIMWDYAVTTPIVVPPAAVDDILPLPIVAPPDAIPLEETEPITIAPPITTTKPRTRKRDKDIYNVYDLHVGAPGFFRNYVWGEGFTEIRLSMGAIWKYGLTSFKSVYARYLVISKIYPSEKESYILEKLSNAELLPKQWYLQNASYSNANAREVQLIDAYVTTNGKLPPGNTFRG